MPKGLAKGAKLEVLDVDGEVLRTILLGERAATTIGRNAEMSDELLDHPAASRRHVAVMYKGAERQFYVRCIHPLATSCVGRFVWCNSCSVAVVFVGGKTGHGLGFCERDLSEWNAVVCQHQQATGAYVSHQLVELFYLSSNGTPDMLAVCLLRPMRCAARDVLSFGGDIDVRFRLVMVAIPKVLPARTPSSRASMSSDDGLEVMTPDQLREALPTSFGGGVASKQETRGTKRARSAADLHVQNKRSLGSTTVKRAVRVFCGRGLCPFAGSFSFVCFLFVVPGL